MGSPDINDPGLLTPAQASLLIDQYERAMASSYLMRGMNEPAAFELFVRHLPPRRHWLLVAGLGPALALVEAMRFGEEELLSWSAADSTRPSSVTWSASASRALLMRCPRARSPSRASRSCG